ncbi:MAG TPA: type I methionyl aminopeptidase [Candidatus Xenobia bacterium]|jgi:methionyl aminopeptidase
MITLKSEREIEVMQESGRITAAVLHEIKTAIVPGVSTLELDRVAENAIRRRGAVPAFKGYRQFPSSVCISVNEEVVHGIPNKRKILRVGDIVGLDMGVIWKGWYSDSAITVAVGDITSDAQKLLDVTRESLFKGIEKALDGGRVGDIGHAVQSHVEQFGYSIVRDLVGHGVGRQLHEEPQVPNFGEAGYGEPLRAGMVIAIEPMVNMGTKDVAIKRDNWTIVTQDGQLSAHFEHTVAITRNGPVILTLPEGANIPCTV